MKLHPRARAALRQAAAISVAWFSLAALAAGPAKDVKPGASAAASTPAVDVELLLRSCAGEAFRNAKLYAARAHGIELMKRSADRDQGRSMLRIEEQLDGTLSSLRGKTSAQAELDRMEDALVGLTELTLQQPLVNQIDAALRLAERAAAACSATVTKLGHDQATSPLSDRVRALSSMLATSQQLAGRYLVTSFKRDRAGGAAERDAQSRLAAAFDADLARLRDPARQDAALAETLLLLDGQWLFVRHALARPGENQRRKIEDVGRASEHLFMLLDTELRRQRQRG